MINLIQLFLAIALIILACIATYKITVPLCLKIIDLCFDSNHFRVGICIFMAIAFCTAGLFQLKDFVTSTEFDLSWFFPLSLFVSGIFLVLGFLKMKPQIKP